MRSKTVLFFIIMQAFIIQTSTFSNIDYRIKTEYYYNLKFLKNAGPPQEIKMIRINNLARKKPLVTKGILFTYKNRGALRVSISGNFSQWKSVPMNRNKNGVWFFYLDEFRDHSKIKYKFVVNEIWLTDPENPNREDDGAGSYVSLADPSFTDEGKTVTYRIINKNRVEFRIYKPDARFISVVGDFNFWNTENDLLEKGNDGIWRLQKRIPPGKYRYKFIIDGRWLPDTYNKNSASDQNGEICSILEVKQ